METTEDEEVVDKSMLVVVGMGMLERWVPFFRPSLSDTWKREKVAKCIASCEKKNGKLKSFRMLKS